MWHCIFCDAENNNDDDFCTSCGTAQFKAYSNHCNNPDCKAYYIILPDPNQRYCGKCGRLTTAGKELENTLNTSFPF